MFYLLKIELWIIAQPIALFSVNFQAQNSLCGLKTRTLRTYLPKPSLYLDLCIKTAICVIYLFFWFSYQKF